MTQLIFLHRSISLRTEAQDLRSQLTKGKPVCWSSKAKHSCQSFLYYVRKNHILPLPIVTQCRERHPLSSLLSGSYFSLYFQCVSSEWCLPQSFLLVCSVYCSSILNYSSQQTSRNCIKNIFCGFVMKTMNNLSCGISHLFSKQSVSLGKL